LQFRSCTEQLARLAAPPVLVLFPHGETAAPSYPVSYRKLLVLADSEVSSEQALRAALHLADRVGAGLVQASIASASDDLASISIPSTSHGHLGGIEDVHLVSPVPL
jgi:hypothetical protein